VAELDDETINVFYMDVGRHVRNARVRAGATQAQLAEMASMTRSSVANIEAGRQRVPVHTLVVIAAALNLNPGDLFPPRIGGEGSVELSALTARLEKEPQETRDFIEGAIVQLGIQTRKEGQ
jgi:transcriptional regulator with XRE-family HTH domain